MPREVSLHITDAYRRRFPDLAFGIGTIKTRVEPVGKDIAVYIFTAPGIQEEQVSNGLQLALEILKKFGYEKEAWSHIYKLQGGVIRSEFGEKIIS